MPAVHNSSPGISQDVTAWLVKKTRVQAGLLIGGGIALSLLGFVLVYLQYLGTKVGLGFLNERYVSDIEGKSIGWGSTTVKIAAGLVTALLFACYHVVAEHFTEDFEIELSANTRVKVTVAQYTDYGWTQMFEGWHFLLFFLRIVSAVLFLGPQTVSAGVRQIQRARKLLTLDIAGCSQVLGFIASWREKVPFKVLRNKLPELELPRLLSQISYIDGVVFRKSDPPGVSLAPHLRDEIQEWSNLPGQQLSSGGIGTVAGPDDE